MSSEAEQDSSDSEPLPTGHSIPRTDSEDTEPFTKDVLFELLKNRRRRDVLRYLRDTDDDVVTLSDLAEHVAALENDITEAQLTSKQRKRVYVALYQCHLPILSRAGVIEFNQARGLIERTERADQLSPYFEESHPADARWSKRYGQLVLAGGIAYAITIAMTGLNGLAPFVSFLFIVSVGLMALYQFHQETDRSLIDLVTAALRPGRPQDNPATSTD